MTQQYGPDVELDGPAFVHPTAVIHGKVRLEVGSSLWPYAVIRAESAEVRIGGDSNIQDFVMIHTEPGLPTIVGAHCSITHHATLHCCMVGDNCLIGINATVMNGAEIGANSIVAGHCIVTEGSRIPDNSVVAGVPGRVIREHNNFITNRLNAAIYLHNALAYSQGRHRALTGPDFEDFLANEVARLSAEYERLYGVRP